MPVLVLDLDEQEAAKLLALHDPLAGLAETDQDVLADLLAQVETENDAVQKLLDEMLAAPGSTLEEEPTEGSAPETPIPEAYQVVVECRDEAHQKELFERLTADGLTCRLLTL